MRIRCTSKNALLSCTKKAFCARSSARPLKGQLGVCLPRGPRFRRMPIGANLFGNVPAPHFIIVITRFPPFFAGKTREGRERERGGELRELLKQTIVNMQENWRQAGVGESGIGTRESVSEAASPQEICLWWRVPFHKRRRFLSVPSRPVAQLVS